MSGKSRGMVGEIVALSWPTVVEQALQTVVQFADSAMVGRIGAQASASVGMTTSVTWLVNAPLFAMGVGVLATIARASGAGDTDTAKRAASQSILLALVIGVCVGALTLAVSPFLPTWLGADPALHADGAAYFAIICAPMLFRASIVIFGSVLRAVGVPRERLNSLLTQMRALGGGLTVSESEDYGDLRLEILYDGNSPKMAVDEAVRLAAESLNEYTYAVEDTPLNRRIYEMLKLRGLKLSVAESFTGGGVAQKLIEVPGVSEVLFESVVAYDNGSKMKRLGVQQNTLARFGAVSDETAYEMAAGLIASGNCSVSVATTGIAGPASDNTNKPVGLCYIAVGTRETVFVYKYMFKGGREDITRRAVNQALFLLYKQIK